MRINGLLPLAAGVLAACSSSDDGPAPEVEPGVTTYVGFVRENGFAGLRRGDGAFAWDFGIVSEAEGGVALDYFGNAYQADIRAGDGAVRVFWSVRKRSFDGGTGVFSVPFDRVLSGFQTTLIEPRNVAIAQRAGLLMVTDTSDGLVKVWGTAAAGDVPPLFTAAPAAAPWDLAYDEGADRLFAALVDGTIAVFDDFAANRPAAPTRTIVPTADGATPRSSALRGIALDPRAGTDRLWVTDPGAPMNGADGAVYAVEGVAVGSGLLMVSGTIDASFAEPVDVVLTAGGFARVADVERNELVVVRLGAGAAAPLRTPLENPNGIAIEPRQPIRTVPSPGDIDDPTIALDGLIIAAGPDAAPATITLVDEGLTEPAERTFAFDRPVAALAVDALGDLHLSNQIPFGNGAIAVLHRFTTQRGIDVADEFDLARDRNIALAVGFFGGTSFVNPAGIDLGAESDLIVLADPGTPALFVVGRTAGPEANELLLLDDAYTAGSAEPLAVDYDDASDRLYVGVSNGTVYVYDRLSQGPGTFPDRILTPADQIGATQASVRIASLVYDAANDRLFLGDTGAATGVGADGAILVFESASTASGLVTPDVTIAGPLSGLDDPVSLAWNGAHLWVADRATGEVKRFDDAATLTGDTAPTATAAVPDVSAIALAPAGLAPTEGGSIPRSN